MLTPRAAASALRQAQWRVRPRLAAQSAAQAWRAISSSSSSSSSVSPDEVAHFNALASSWWDPHGSSRLLHQMNPLRHDFIRQCVRDTAGPETSLPARILDVGCGGGIFAESAARLATTASVTAIDPSPEVLAVAQGHARQDPALSNKLQYVQASIEDMGADATLAPFDMVTLFEVVEHVAIPPATFLAQCGRLLRPGGWLVGSTMARTWTSWLTTIVAAEDVLGIVPRGTHDWAKYINADELTACFAGGADGPAWETLMFQGVVYMPGLGWQVVPGGEKLGNYFFGIRKSGGV